MPPPSPVRATVSKSSVPPGKEWWLFPLVVTVALRILDSAVAAVADAVFPANVPIENGLLHAPRTTGVMEALVGAVTRFDVPFYTEIAQHGYGWNHLSAAFFPLYPAILGAVSDPLHLDIFGISAVGLVFNTLALYAGLVLLYRMLIMDYSRAVVRTTILILALFPSSFSYTIPYTESLFLVLSVGSLYAARRERWALAGVLTFLATTCRVAGLLLVVPIAVRWWSLHKREWRARIGQVAWQALAPVGLAVVLVGQYLDIGEFPAAFIEQLNWREPTLPFVPLVDAVGVLIQIMPGITYTAQASPSYYLNILHNQLDLVGAVFMLVVAIAGFYSISRDYALYLFLSLAFYLSNVFRYTEPLAAIMRYVGVCFPLYLIIAQWGLEARRRQALLLALCAVFFVWHVYWVASFVTYNWVV